MTTRKIQTRVTTTLLLACLFIFQLLLFQQQAHAEDISLNLVLVTLDGVRWQEVFGGIDLDVIDDERYGHNSETLKKNYWRERRAERRKLLFPFLWSTISHEGVMIGDREQGSYMEVTNSWWFSYPGYNEILTGRADSTIDSNDRNWNSNVTFLEILNGMSGFRNRVMAFMSWDVFPYIINTQRSRLPVNVGPDARITPATEQTRWLNGISSQAPRLWTTVRLDLLTHGYALEALQHQKPRVIYIAYGETDDFAHDGRYDRYIDAAHRTDRMLEELWTQLQEDPFYRDQTVLIITTDHGRGETPEGWPHHASPSVRAPNGVPGSNQIWLAAIGPVVQSKGLLKGRWKQSQIAATALASLKLNPSEIMPKADSGIRDLFR